MSEPVPAEAITAIRAELDQAYAMEREARNRIKRLTEQLVAACLPVRHWWPMGESNRMCGSADGDVTGDPKGVTCQACIDSVPADVVALLRGES